MIELATLAPAVTALLAPHLPALLELGKEVGKEVAKKGVDAGWDKAVDVWQKVHPKIESSPKAKIAVEDVVENPDADAFKQVLTARIAEILKADPDFAKEVAALMPAASGGGAKYHVDIKDSQDIIVGDHGTVNIGEPRK